VKVGLGAGPGPDAFEELPESVVELAEEEGEAVAVGLEVLFLPVFLGFDVLLGFVTEAT
jgi:hypothetical protein